MILLKLVCIIAFLIVFIQHFNPLFAQIGLSNIEVCWSQRQILLKKETSKVGKTRNLHIYTAACSSENELVEAVEIEYKMLIANQNRFATEDNSPQNSYETKLTYIDADELENCIFSLQKLQSHLNSPKLDTTELLYTSRAGFKIHTVFNPQWEKWAIYIEFPDKKRNKISRNTLMELTKLLQQAKNRIEN
jgi:hypothetical protein